MNSKLLKSKVIAKGFSMRQFICKINEHSHYMDISTFYKKLNGTSEFTRKDIDRIKKILGLSAKDVEMIFFASTVS